jgi:hypothetical protein
MNLCVSNMFYLDRRGVVSNLPKDIRWSEIILL